MTILSILTMVVKQLEALAMGSLSSRWFNLSYEVILLGKVCVYKSMFKAP